MLLTAAETVALGRRVRGGDLVARDALVQEHRPFAVYLASLYGRRCRCREDDLFQSALLGLIRGVNAWDPDGHPGKTFLTYVRYHVRAGILDYLYDRSLIRIPHSARPTEMARRPVAGMVKLKWKEHRAWIEHCVAKSARVVQGQDAELNHPDSSQCDLDVDESHAEDLEQLRLGLGMLPLWHAEVLSRRFGLGGRPRQTIRTIAEEAGIGRQTVWNVQNRALQRLRKIMVIT
jgi:RNA polymerase sigma factor (sigma-70 family)